MTAKARPGNGQSCAEDQGDAERQVLNVGQHVRHVRRPVFGVGKIAEIYPNGSCKAIFPGRVFTGLSTSLFEPVCMEAIRKEEQETARQKEAEREAALKRKRQQSEEATQRLLEARRNMWPGYSFSRTEDYFDKELQRLEMLSEAIPNSRDQDDSGLVGTAGENWWYQSIKKGERKNDFPPIETKVVGVSYEGRQGVIAQMEKNEQVLLVREPDNPHDENAVSVPAGQWPPGRLPAPRFGEQGGSHDGRLWQTARRRVYGHPGS